MAAVFTPVLMHLPRSWQGHGVFEDIPEGLSQLWHNGMLFGLVFTYFCSIALYNFCGLAVAKRLSAIHRTLIDACRSVLVWGINVTLFYATSNGGEPCVSTTVCLSQLTVCLTQLTLFAALNYRLPFR